MSPVKTATPDEMSALHALVASVLAQRIRSGEATAADLNVARAFLKDNNVQALATSGSPLGNLVATLPFAGGTDSDEYIQH